MGICASSPSQSKNKSSAQNSNPNANGHPPIHHSDEQDDSHNFISNKPDMNITHPAELFPLVPNYPTVSPKHSPMKLQRQPSKIFQQQQIQQNEQNNNPNPTPAPSHHQPQSSISVTGRPAPASSISGNQSHYQPNGYDPNHGKSSVIHFNGNVGGGNASGNKQMMSNIHQQQQHQIHHHGYQQQQTHYPPHHSVVSNDIQPSGSRSRPSSRTHSRQPSGVVLGNVSMINVNSNGVVVGMGSITGNVSNGNGGKGSSRSRPHSRNPSSLGPQNPNPNPSSFTPLDLPTISNLLSSLPSHPETFPLQCVPPLCKSLASLSLSHSDVNFLHTHRIMTQLLHVLILYSTNPAIVPYVCSAIRHLSRNSILNDDITNNPSGINGITILCSLIVQFEFSSAITERTVGALQTVCLTKQHCHSLISPSVSSSPFLPILYRIIERWGPVDVRILRHALNLLWLLVDYTESVGMNEVINPKYYPQDSPLLSLVFIQSSYYAKNPFVSCNASALLRSISYGNNFSSLLSASPLTLQSSLQVILDAFSYHLNDIIVMRQSLMALSNVVENEFFAYHFLTKIEGIHSLFTLMSHLDKMKGRQENSPITNNNMSAIVSATSLTPELYLYELLFSILSKLLQQYSIAKDKFLSYQCVFQLISSTKYLVQNKDLRSVLHLNSSGVGNGGGQGAQMSEGEEKILQLFILILIQFYYYTKSAEALGEFVSEGAVELICGAVSSPASLPSSAVSQSLMDHARAAIIVLSKDPTGREKIIHMGFGKWIEGVNHEEQGQGAAQGNGQGAVQSSSQTLSESEEDRLRREREDLSREEYKRFERERKHGSMTLSPPTPYSDNSNQPGQDGYPISTDFSPRDEKSSNLVSNSSPPNSERKYQSDSPTSPSSPSLPTSPPRSPAWGEIRDNFRRIPISKAALSVPSSDTKTTRRGSVHEAMNSLRPTVVDTAPQLANAIEMEQNLFDLNGNPLDDNEA